MRYLLIFVLAISLVSISLAKPATRLCPSGACHYVIVAPTSLAANFQPLADWKTSRGVVARVVTTEFIEEQYPCGNQVVSVRSFLRDAYKTWGIKYALLGGDVELIGCRMVKTKVHEYETMPADLYFASFEGNWNADGDNVFGEVSDNVDLDPEIFVGRASVRTPEEVTTFVDKVLTYEKAPPKELGKRCLWLGANLDERTFGKDVCTAIIKDAQVPNYIENKILSTVDGNLNVETMKEAITEFVPNIMFVAAHGGDQVIAFDGSYVQAQDADELTNDFPFIYVAICCLTNKFDTDCITENMMRNPNGGAVAAWACSRYGWYAKENAGYGASDVVTKDMFNLLYRSYLEEPPSLGELIHRARRKFIERSQKDNTFRWLTYGMNLLGCPEMPVWTGSQQEIEIGVFDNSQFAQDSLDVTVTSNGAPVKGANVTVWRASSDSPIIVTAWGLNLVPRSVETEVLSDIGGELLVSGRTKANGSLRLLIKRSPQSAAILVEELLALNNGLERLADYLKNIDQSDRKKLERLMRDYTYTQHRLSEKERNLISFFKEQARLKRWSVAEEALDTIYQRMSSEKGNIKALHFVLTGLSKALAFDWSAFSEENSPQGRVFRKILRLKKQVGQLVVSSVPQHVLGRITVTSKPKGAKVLIDGIPVGKTPSTFKVVPGEHAVSAVLSGTTIGTSSVVVEKGQTQSCHFDLASERSFSGKVVLYDADSNAGVNVVVYQIGANNSTTEYARVVTGKDGHFKFEGLPREYLYVHIECEGYSNEAKLLDYSAPEMTQDFELYKLATIFGTVELPAGQALSLKLYANEQNKMVLKAEREVQNGDEFFFSKLPPGDYLVGLTGPGLTAAKRWAKLEKGNSKVVGKLVVGPIETVQLAHYVGGEKKWQIFEMMKDENGIYRMEYPAPPSEEAYWFLFVLNKGLDRESWVMDKHNQPQGNQGSTCSTIIIQDEGTEVFFDPADTPMIVKVQESQQSD